MVKLVNPSVSENEIEAGRQKTRDKNQGKEVDIESTQNPGDDEKRKTEA
jgi:hypothetical protein